MTQVLTTPCMKMFLLIQRGKVVALSTLPHRLSTHKLDPNVDWEVYGGCINEFGNAEIVGPVAHVWVGRETTTVRCYLEKGKIRRPDDPVKTPSNIGFFVRSKLFRLFQIGDLNDPMNYTQVKVFVC